MRLMPLDKVQPGMRLAKRIYNYDGIVLLNEQVELSQSLILRLKDHGIQSVYIFDSRTDDLIISDMISEETRLKAITEIRNNFRRVMDDNNRRRMPYYQLGKTFGNVMSMIIDDLSNHKDAMIMLTNMSLVDHYLYQHSLNVCIYATMLGISAGYNRDELMTLGLGSLLHDIGKTQINPNILFKPEKLTDEEYKEIKMHSEAGYRILKDEPNIPLLSAHVAFQHHERLNGTGYPRGIKGKEIHDYAQWVGIVDSYDAMTSDRVYRDAMLPHQALELLFTGSGTLYDTEKIEIFRDKLAIYPIGSWITIDSGEMGVVVDLNSISPQRPVIRILQEPNGEELSQPYEIDLSKKLSVMITEVNHTHIR